MLFPLLSISTAIIRAHLTSHLDSNSAFLQDSASIPPSASNPTPAWQQVVGFKREKQEVGVKSRGSYDIPNEVWRGPGSGCGNETLKWWMDTKL